MKDPRAPAPTFSNLKWDFLRHSCRSFPTVGDCAEYCVPSLRACARLFGGSLSEGDDLVEEFLEGLFALPATQETLRTPRGLTAAFETFLRCRYGAQSRRILLSVPPERTANTWMTVDEFLRALSRL